MGRPRKNPLPETTVATELPTGEIVDTQSLIDEIEQLKREKAELLEAATTEGKPAPNALSAILEQQANMLQTLVGHAVVDKNKEYRSKINQKYVFTDERKAQIEDILRQYMDKGIEWKWNDDAPTVTFSRKIKVRRWDKEVEAWTYDTARKLESLHASTADRYFHIRLKAMTSVDKGA